MTLYERIASGYDRCRRPDRRLTERLIESLALPEGAVLADVGSGTGKYARSLADAGFRVVAIEPSGAMLARAPPHPQVTYLEGAAEALPVEDDGVDAVCCILAITHFRDLGAALAEMDRVARTGRIVVVTVDPRLSRCPWFARYFPEVDAHNRARALPIGTLAERIHAQVARRVSIEPIEVPRDFEDLFAGAAWSRPELCLDAGFRSSSSSFAALPAGVVQPSVARLAADIASGVFRDRYGSDEGALDVGLRLIAVAAR